MSSGEKLDHKACESLEEILKRVQFKLIDLEQTNLDEDVRLEPKNSQPLALYIQPHCHHLFHCYYSGRIWSVCPDLV